MRKIKIRIIWLSLCLAINTQATAEVYHSVVAVDGSGDYTSVQAAIDAMPENNLNQYLIYIKAGTYKEHVFIPLNKGHLSLIGEGSDRVIITDNKKSGGPDAIPVDKGATVVVHANDVVFQGISIVNSHGVEANNGPQALALYAKGDRIAIDHCHIMSYQDTYRTSEADNGRNYVSHSLILGAVDFIYGSGNAWLEQCTIKINRKSGGWIVAPKHKPETRWGYVFNHCTLTADGNPKETSIWLGRPWHHQPQTVFLNTRSEITLPAEGWYPTMAGLPSVFAEYNTMDADGKPLDLSKRIKRYYYIDAKKDTVWCTAKNVLTKEEASHYTVEAVMGGDDHWNPEQIFKASTSPIGYVTVDGMNIPVNQYGCFEREHQALELWYRQPATSFNSALPLGNGRIGAMVYGNPINDQFLLNEETISKGSPYANYNPETLVNLQTIRDMIFDGKNAEAQKLADSVIVAPKAFAKGAAYQPAGVLHVDFKNHQNYTDYRRSLDISRAVSTVSYCVGNVSYRQEAFTSLTDHLLIVRYTASEKGKLNFTASLSYPEYPVQIQARGNQLIMEGTTMESAPAVPGKVKFMVNAQINNKGGKIKQNGNQLVVSNSDEVIIYVAMATNFQNYQDLSADPAERIAAYMKNATRPYEELMATHVKAYQNQFERVKLNLGIDKYTDRPTDERVKRFSESDDPWFAALYFQFGRYLLISCSQSGTQPANLQGIWNEKVNPAWLCRYTVNINTEMNYWPAEPCHLSELHDPLIQMVAELSQAGRETARKMYGCRGWVCHHNTDLWRMTGAVDYAYSGDWPMAGAWLCQHLWQRYLYHGDKDFLSRVYPYMKGAAEFFVDFLVKDPRTGYQVVCPSVSPENCPQGRWGQHLYAGITMDNELIFDLFSHVSEASRLLNTDQAFADTLLTLRSQLTPLRIGQHGQLQEWAEDWDNPNDHHRHVSHLWALYPGNEISPLRTPEAFEAVKASLVHRGDPSTGWSMGWKVCLWARCLDGNHAYQLVKNQLTLVPDSIAKGGEGGTYANLFDAHPPFQIDGNFGCTAGICEMLVQSHDGCVSLLPALPDAWNNGEVSGLCCIGGFIVEDMKWEQGQVSYARIRSTLGGNLRLRSANELLSGTHWLTSATGENTNPLFVTSTMTVTRRQGDGYVTADTHPSGTTSKYVWDISTSAGDIIEVYAKK